MKEHLSYLLENERLLPFTDPLDMTVIHALLGFGIFKQVILDRRQCLSSTDAVHRAIRPTERIRHSIM